jgi:hypothetical protein
VNGCNEKLHHACQCEWESGGPGQDSDECDKFCVAYHPAAKLFAVVAKPSTRAMSKAGSKDESASAPTNNTTALSASFALTQEVR